MLDTIRGELWKLLSTRASRLVALAAVAVPLLTVFAANSADPAVAARPLAEQQSWFFTVVLSRVVFVIVGLRVLSDEYRFRTVIPSLLATGSRTRLFVAKVLTAYVAAAALAAVMAAAFLAAATAYWRLSSATEVATGEGFGVVALRFAAAAGLWGVVGVAIAGLIKHALPATVITVVWLMVGEDVLRLGIGDAVAWLPGQAGLAFAVDAEVPGLSMTTGGLRLLAWSVLLCLPAALVVRRRDVH